MNVSDQLKKVIQLLSSKEVRYALAGGVVASLYRKNERMTKDLDFLLFSEMSTQALAKNTLEALGLKSSLIRKAELEGGPQHAIKNKTTEILLVAGRPQKGENAVGVDFLLPGFPWFDRALERAQNNLVDFGFAKIPCLTVEDMILSKFYSVANRSDRFQDLDDVKEIFLESQEIDLNYLADRMKALKLKVPAPLKALVPDILNKTSKQI